MTSLFTEELKSSLLVHEQRMKGLKDIIKEQALKFSNAGRRAGKGQGRYDLRGLQRRDFVEWYKYHKHGNY